MTPRALVIGRGIAGLTCANLLARHGWEVEVWGGMLHPAPALVLNNETCGLLRDVWQAENDLFEGSHILNERKVCWGTEKPISIVTQSSIAIKGDLLLGNLLMCLNREYEGQVRVDASPDHISLLNDSSSFSRDIQEFTWVIDASGRASNIAKILGSAKRHSFGQRCVIGTEVSLVGRGERNATFLETVSDGWVFLAPLECDRALLQVMVPTAPEEPSTMLADLLEQTRIIKPHVGDVSGPAEVFKVSPQMSVPLCGPGWFAVGDAAVSLDPICGDGTGYAIREAILAVSVIEGIGSGLSRNNSLRHYTLRLHKAFFSHIKQCLKYYSDGFKSSAWEAEVDLMKKSFLLDEYRTAHTENVVYGLKGVRLVTLGSAP